jgi:hypothetical protein
MDEGRKIGDFRNMSEEKFPGEYISISKRILDI